MSLAACPDCRRQISTKAERCPHCGCKRAVGSQSESSVPYLVSVAEVRRRKVKCRECSQEVSIGAGSCPNCGCSAVGEARVRWKLLLVLALLATVTASAIAWQLGLLPQRIAISSGAVVADSATIESELWSLGPRRRRDPPRIKSAQYPAACLSPAPVFVYRLDRRPTTYFVHLNRRIPNPAVVADSLVTRHGLQSKGYEPQRNAFYVSDASVSVVAALRCETVVSSIEEVSYNDDEEIRPRGFRRIRLR